MEIQMAKGNHSIGSKAHATSYPDPALAGSTGSMDSAGLGPTNMNAVNYDCDPPVFNESPATKKSYSWNRGDAGNAN
jgi:hypothetical protein